MLKTSLAAAVAAAAVVDAGNLPGLETSLKKILEIGRSSTEDGRLITLKVRDGVYSLSVEGDELMSTRQNYSEIQLATIVAESFRQQDCHILVGGLGFGFTLQAVLDNVSAKSRVTVVELLECVVEWNQDANLPLASKALADRRTNLVRGDVIDHVAGKPGSYDAILLDVDNGPDAFTVDSNQSLYSLDGLQKFRQSLKPRGTLGVWSAAVSPAFEKRLARCGFKVSTQKVRARENNKGPTHTLFFGQKTD